MKNFTGKVTDVDNNGNPIKKKSSGKNGKKSGFKKPANLMEVEMNFDSLIFQNAEECFIDPADQQWFEERGIKTKYQISYDTGDIEAVREVLHNIMAALGGRICSDTDDFEPSCTADTLDKLI